MSFATVINCMDGRVQLPVITYLMKKFGVDYIDSITEPGPVKILAETINRENLQSIIQRINVSVKKHGSKKLALIAHFDCAGNPEPDNIQKIQLLQAIKNLKELVDSSVEVIGLWVDSDYSFTELSS